MDILKPIDFNYDLVIEYLKRDPNECMFYVVDNKVQFALEIKKKIYVIEIVNTKGYLEVNILNKRIVSKIIKQQVKEYVINWFDLNYDMKSFYEFAETDKILKEVVERFHGLRDVNIPNLYQALVWGIISQEVTIKLAFMIQRDFVKRFGKSITHKNTTYYIYPYPEDVEKLTENDFEGLKISKNKIECILRISGLIANRIITKQKLIKLNNLKRATEELVKIKGIGPWTANYVLLRCLRYRDAFPMGDVGLQNAIKLVTKSKNKPTIKQLETLNKKWNGYQAYATFYLWRLLHRHDND